MPRFLDKTRWLKSNLKKRTKETFSLDQIRELVQDSLEKPCPYCATILTLTNMSCDHMDSLEYGGKTSFNNLEIICQNCNRAKGNFHKRIFMDLLRIAGKYGKKWKEVLILRLRQGANVYRRKR